MSRVAQVCGTSFAQRGGTGTGSLAIAVSGVAMIAGGAPDWPLALLALGTALLLRARSRPPVSRLGDIAVSLTRARRREEAAVLLVADLPQGAAHPSASHPLGPLRLTDAIEAHRRGRTTELRALLDGTCDLPATVEQRLRATFGPQVVCGSARFPDDATTVDELVRRAREALASEPVSESRG
jgi:hypothetical protein